MTPYLLYEMKKEIYKYAAIASLLVCTACSDSDNGGIPTPPDDGQRPTQEYAYTEVEYREWKSGGFRAWSTVDSKQTITIDNMNWYSPAYDYSRTAWGGRIGMNCSEIVGTEGFFRVTRCNGRSYLLDPDNGAVILHGIQHVRPGESDPHRKAFSALYGTEENWSKKTGELIADNHFNYISYGSNRIEAFPSSMRENLLSPKTQKVAYAENLYLLRTFMWDMKANLGYTFEDDKYNRLVLLFEPTFADYIDKLAREKCALFAGDKHFIGYYLDNELPFASYENSIPRLGIDLKHFLSLPDRYKSARAYAEKFMADNHITVSQITAEHQEKFRSAVADYYYKLTSETVRRYDAQHLILGTRLHDWSKYNKVVVEACARYCDVVSLNYYARWQPEPEFMANLSAWCGNKPFLVSEFYTKADDATYNGQKYDNTEGGGWLVRTQKNRGEFYQNFCIRLLQQKNCVGWVHFEYNDGYSSDGKATNKGIVSLEYEPYEDYLKYVKQLNLDVYSLIDYYDNKQ